MARSDLAIMREQFVAVAAKNLRLRGEGAEKDRPPAERGARNAEMEAALSRGRAGHAAEIRKMQAWLSRGAQTWIEMGMSKSRMADRYVERRPDPAFGERPRGVPRRLPALPRGRWPRRRGDLF